MLFTDLEKDEFLEQAATGVRVYVNNTTDRLTILAKLLAAEGYIEMAKGWGSYDIAKLTTAGIVLRDAGGYAGLAINKSQAEAKEKKKRREERLFRTIAAVRVAAAVFYGLINLLKTMRH